jgi:serine/threonine protein kinase
MEYAPNGNLYDLITQEKTGFSEYKAFEYFIQVVNAVYYLQNNNIIHRDIKPENILIGEDNKIKLCDFGWAKELSLENRSTFCGTVEYMAPEIVGSENYDYGVDIWSLGILLYELLYGHSPFKANNTKNVILNIKLHELTYDDTNKKVSKSCKDLIQKLLNNNPQKRYKIKDILEHPFVKKYQDKYLHSVKKNSSKNLGNEDLDDDLKKIKRANTKYISSKDHQKLFKFNSKINSTPDHQNIPNTEKKINIKPNRLNYDDLSPKKLSSSKQIKLLQKFNDSLQSQFEKAKKSIENINFKNSESCTFEDFRDSQFNSMNNNSIKNEEDKKLEEKKYDEIIKRMYKKHQSSKFNNAFSFNKINNINEEDNQDKDKIDINAKLSTESKKSQSNKNIIFENEFEESVEDEEQKAMIERLNRAYEKYGKENVNNMN